MIARGFSMPSCDAKESHFVRIRVGAGGDLKLPIWMLGSAVPQTSPNHEL